MSRGFTPASSGARSLGHVTDPLTAFGRNHRSVKGCATKYAAELRTEVPKAQKGIVLVDQTDSRKLTIRCCAFATDEGWHLEWHAGQ